MKSKKNRKTIKHIYKINSIKYTKHKSKSKTIKNKKYSHKGGAFLAKGLLKGAMKKDVMGPGLSGESNPGQAPRQGSSLMKSAFSGDKDIKYYFKKGMYALYKVMSSLVTLPIRNLNEVIPPELCKQTTDNNFVCSQSLIQYLLTGSKEDYKKILLDSDKKNCFEFEEDGNKIVKCKQSGGGNIVIGCDKTSIPKFKKNDRVIVLLKDSEKNINQNAAFIELNDKKWLIGTIKNVNNKYTIQIDSGGILERAHTSTDDEINKYDNDWNEFYKEFYNMPNRFLQDLYDIGHKIGDPIIERINKILKFIYKTSGLYKIVQIFTFISGKIWQCYSMLLRMDEHNILFVAMKKIIEKYKKNKFGEKQLNMIVTFNCIVAIYDRYLDGKSIEETLAELDDNYNRIQVAIGKKLKIIQEKLIKFNLYLRKYECPMKKLESFIRPINNIELLKKLLESCNLLLGDEKNYIEIEKEKKETKENRIERIKTCDSIYRQNFALSITPDSTYMHFNIDPEKQTNQCSKICSTNAWAEVIVRYGCFFSKALNGNKNNMTYILMNIVQDMATININNSEDPIIGNIKFILKNIECRSNLRHVIINRINDLNEPKKSKSIEDEGDNDE